MLKKPGVLIDNVRFGRWLYTWEDKDYILYQADYGAARPHQMFFLLSPRDEDDTEGRYHSATDALLTAVGAWSTELHDEIYVFDNGIWIKDKDLWKSVQDASWDEVILNREMKTNLINDIQGMLVFFHFLLSFMNRFTDNFQAFSTTQTSTKSLPSPGSVA